MCVICSLYLFSKAENQRAKKQYKYPQKMKKLVMMTLIVSTIVLASSVQNLFGQNPVVSFKSTKNVVCPGTATNFINNSYPVAPATSIVSFKFTFGGSANP